MGTADARPIFYRCVCAVRRGRAIARLVRASMLVGGVFVFVSVSTDANHAAFPLAVHPLFFGGGGRCKKHIQRKQ